MLQNKVVVGNYMENGRHLKEQFIIGIHDDAVTSGIVKELTTVKSTGSITSHEVLL